MLVTGAKHKMASHTEYRFSTRRALALAITAILNTGVLLWLLLPAVPLTISLPRPPNLVTALRLHLRFEASRQAPRASPAKPATEPPSRRRRRTVIGALPLHHRRPAHWTGLQPTILANPASLLEAVAPPGIGPSANRTSDARPLAHFENRGLRQRLQAASAANAIHGLPGTASHRMAGLRLQDPLQHGLAAAMHTTQRLFGIARRDCIDVQVEESLSPQQLIDRHLTTADVKADEQRYDCNRPPGLSF